MNKEVKNSLISGVLSVIVPHLGCIAFVILTLLGISTGAVFFHQFLANRFAFPLLIALSFVLAGISSFFYLKKNCCVNKTKYVGILFASVLVFNGILFYGIFPWAANVNGQSSNPALAHLSDLKLKVEIPCTGHASLITNSLKEAGAEEIIFKQPDIFSVKYDSNIVVKDNLLNLDIFDEYQATEI